MKIVLNGDFCFSEAPWLMWSDIKYGLENGFINSAGAVEYALKALASDSSTEHYELASLAGEDVIGVQKCVDCLADKSSKNYRDEDKVWMFLILLWVFKNRNSYPDPLGIVEELYADFDYPESVSPVVRYMPAVGFSQEGEAQLLQNWSDMLDLFREELQSSRSVQNSGF